MRTIDEIRETVSPIAENYGVAKLYIFGSYARGDNTDDSDIDLRIDKGQVKGLQMAALLLDLEEALQKPVDLISTTALSPSFLDSIAREEKLIYAAV